MVVHFIVRPLLSLLALVWLTLGMTVPVSAWTVHEGAHAAARVSVDVHHHHEADGSIAVHDHDTDGSGGDTPDGGHDHMPSILLSAFAIPDAGFSLDAPLMERATYTMSQVRGVERHGTGGLRRPPRFG